jgi:hypothetical protein
MAGVTSSYPAALDSESNLTPPNNGDTLSVADHWLAGNAGPIVAIETELGTDPAGYAADVKTRLNTINPSSGLLAANGLQFPGTQSASADANTLDDYEEGTWTPQAYKGTTEITSPNARFGSYIKIGKLVWINFYFYVSSGSATGSDAWFISTPFTVEYSSGNGTAYQSVPAGYMALVSTNYQGNGDDHRWQANNGDKLTLYGPAAVESWTSGYLEFAGTGVLQTT